MLIGLAMAELEHLKRLRAALERLQDTTAQIRVRGAFLLLVGLTTLATSLGLEVILGAFIAGAILKLVDRDVMITHPELRDKLDAVGYGVFIPVFFVSVGIGYDLGALGDLGTLAMVPVFLAALLASRGLPALLYRRSLSSRELRRRGAPAGDLAALHRRRDRDRRRSRRRQARYGRRLHRRRPRLGDRLPGDRALAAQTGRLGGGCGQPRMSSPAPRVRKPTAAASWSGAPSRSE